MLQYSIKNIYCPFWFQGDFTVVSEHYKVLSGHNSNVSLKPETNLKTHDFPVSKR